MIFWLSIVFGPWLFRASRWVNLPGRFCLCMYKNCNWGRKMLLGVRYGVVWIGYWPPWPLFSPPRPLCSRRWGRRGLFFSRGYTLTNTDWVGMACCGQGGWILVIISPPPWPSPVEGEGMGYWSCPSRGRERLNEGFIIHWMLNWKMIWRNAYQIVKWLDKRGIVVV